MSMTLEQAKEKLAKYGQEHVLKYYGELNEEEKQGILDQIETTDMSRKFMRRSIPTEEIYRHIKLRLS